METNLWNQLPYATTLYKHKDGTFTARCVLNFYSQKNISVKGKSSTEALEMLIQELKKVIPNS